MMPEIRIGVRGHQLVSQRLQVAADVFGSLVPVFDEVVHPWFLDHMEQQFLTSGAHGGVPWEGYDNEPIYRAVKAKLTGYLQLLRWDFTTERLYPSLTDPGHADHVYQRTAHSMRAGSSVEYLPRLIEGGEGPFGERYPGRDPFKFRASQIGDSRRGLIREILRHMQDRIREARIVRSQ